MQLTLKFIMFLTGIILLGGCVPVEQPKLPANYFYKGSYINIHSPNQKGWYEIHKSNQGIIFAKNGSEAGSSYIAQVLFFPLTEEIKDKNKLLELIKEEAIKKINKDRYNLLQSSFTLYEKREYPCILATSLTEDKKAKVSPNKRAKLLMEIKSLYCKDPKTEKRGFLIGYSYRGSNTDTNLSKDADSFISGVEFPEY